MLKFQIDSLDGIDDAVKGLYEKKGDKYQLKVDGIPQGEDVAGLKAKVDELLAEKKDAQRKTKEAEDAAKAAAEEAARKNGDVSALEKSWQEKLAKREGELQAQIESLNGNVNKMLIDNVAVTMANEIALQGSADLLMPHIKSRLAAEQRDGQFVTVIRDKDGKPSAASLDDLKNEFANNPAFAPVIVGSKAAGGGASGGKQGGGAANQNAKPNWGGSKDERLAAINARLAAETE
jgi:hypothetical protein